jgi:hypothetical protein
MSCNPIVSSEAVLFHSTATAALVEIPKEGS